MQITLRNSVAFRNCLQLKLTAPLHYEGKTQGCLINPLYHLLLAEPSPRPAL